MCVDKRLTMVNDADESSMSKLFERLHQGLEEGGVVGLRVGVSVEVVDCSSSPDLLDLGSYGG